MRWYHRIVSVPRDDFDRLGDELKALQDFMRARYEELKEKAATREGMLIMKVAANLPGLAESVYAYHQECDAVMSFLNVREGEALVAADRRFTENYNRVLNQSQTKQWAGADVNVIMYKELQIEVGLTRSLFAGLSKQLENLHFQLTNLTKLKVMGMEDATL